MATVTLPFPMTAGQLIEAAKLLADFNALIAGINTIDGTQFSSTAALLLNGTMHADLSAYATPTYVHDALNIKATGLTAYFTGANVKAVLLELGSKTITPTSFTIAATDSWPVTQAHGLSYVPVVDVLFRAKQGAGTYGMYFHTGVYYQSDGTNAYWIGSIVLCDATNIVVNLYQSNNVGAPYATNFSAASKAKFYLPNSAGAWVNTWDTVEAKIIVKPYGV